MANAKFLVFVDTNILLDFYRVRGRESDLSILTHIDKNLDRFIITSQVEMEFKKNRQRVILDTSQVFKMPTWEGLQLPGFLTKARQSAALSRNQNEVKKLSGQLKARMERVLRASTDPVYRTAERMFKHGSALNLSRDKKERFAIRRLAWKRFILGYPPRKEGDTSIGDAINWEWIIRCAQNTGNHVVIVSRDSDFGMPLKDGPVLNDWLRQEFRERVSKRRKIVLTDRLSTGLKTAAITVSRKEQESEEQFLEARATAGTGLTNPTILVSANWANQEARFADAFKTFIEKTAALASALNPKTPPVPDGETS